MASRFCPGSAGRLQPTLPPLHRVAVKSFTAADVSPFSPADEAAAAAAPAPGGKRAYLEAAQAVDTPGAWLPKVVAFSKQDPMGWN